MNRKVIGLLGVIGAMNASAATLTEVNDSARIINEVVVTGTGTYHRINNSPVAVKVLSASDLKSAQVTSLQDALVKLTTNVTTNTNGMGTFVNVNGMSDDYIVILENGKRLMGDDRWNRINVNNIKRIEILNGAASALYGSDAIAGVINVITEDSNSAASASSYTKLNSKGRVDESVNLDFNIGKFSNYTAYNYKAADNWQVNKYQSFSEVNNETGETEDVLKLTGRPMSTGFVSHNVSERMQWRFDDHFSVYLRGNYFDNMTNRPKNAVYFTQKDTKGKDAEGNTTHTYTYSEKTAYTYDLHHKAYTYGGGARYEVDKYTHFYFDVLSDNNVSKYAYWQTPTEEAYEETRKRTHYTNETLKGIFHVSDWNKISTGIDFVQESLNSESDNIDFETTNTYNAFAQDEITIMPGLEAVLGLRYTYNDKFHNHLTPNASLFFHTYKVRLRAGYTGGYRTPTLSQMYATDQAKTNSRYTINNTSLKPEKNDFWNLNAEYSNDWMLISATMFWNNIRDMINYRVMTQDEIDADSHLTELYNDGWTTIRQRDNIDKAKLHGVSAQVKFILPAGFSLNGGYTYTDSKSRTKTLNTKTQQYEEKVAPVDKSVANVGNVSVTWDRTWGNYHLNANLSGHIQGRRYSSTYGYADRYQQWDFCTRHTFRLDSCVIEPSLGVENIFNQRDTAPWNSNFSTINPGRSIFVSLMLRM